RLSWQGSVRRGTKRVQSRPLTASRYGCRGRGRSRGGGDLVERGGPGHDGGERGGVGEGLAREAAPPTGATLQLVVGEQALRPTGARPGDVSGRADGAVGELARQGDLPVRDVAEVFEEHLVHRGVGIAGHHADHRERAALVEGARCAEVAPEAV